MFNIGFSIYNSAQHRDAIFIIITIDNEAKVHKRKYLSLNRTLHHLKKEDN